MWRLVAFRDHRKTLSTRSSKTYKLSIGIQRAHNVFFLFCLINLEQFTVVMDMIDILIRIIDVTRDPFTFQDIGILELHNRNRTEQNLVEIVRV